MVLCDRKVATCDDYRRPHICADESAHPPKRVEGVLARHYTAGQPLTLATD